MKLRVHFDNGTTTEFETKARTIDLGGRIVTARDILAVRYHPDDHSTVKLDVDAIKVEAAAKDRELTDQAIARAEAELDGSAPPTAFAGTAESFDQSAASFAASARAFLESSVAMASISTTLQA